ncbi:hypothetical protein B0I35DRAFT_464197 [Stachybotrys elegans]|uniref:Fe2OG dioxygenase domain-containing protein n=1 Tax=Stachybotrys elegans TaxID=80388 RepID=A0A8K0WMF0_9HYPO|nr:hypothetical protein B0I35DRAFT_464197 [Stachybotrys elegans]
MPALIETNDGLKANSLQHLALLDMSAFLHGDAPARLEFAQSLAGSLKTYGMAKLRAQDLVGCNIPGLFEMAKQFFDLDVQAKMSAAMPTSGNPHRGYSFIGQENISGITGFADSLKQGKSLIDVKETYDMGVPGDVDAENRWPHAEALPDFRRLMEEQYRALEQAHLQILSALALTLGLPSESFTSMCSKSHHEMRLLHYPPTRLGDLKAGKTRIADHTDFGSVTLLFQDSTGGLEGRHPSSAEYRAIQSNEQECLVMLGDCFQRWTGDHFWALPHRVTMPFAAHPDQDDERLPERFSIAFFGKPDRDANVGNLAGPHFQKVHYDSMTAGDYNHSKLVRTY